MWRPSKLQKRTPRSGRGNDHFDGHVQSLPTRHRERGAKGATHSEHAGRCRSSRITGHASIVRRHGRPTQIG